jgi:hypothetical protein
MTEHGTLENVLSFGMTAVGVDPASTMQATQDFRLKNSLVPKLCLGTGLKISVPKQSLGTMYVVKSRVMLNLRRG